MKEQIREALDGDRWQSHLQKDTWLRWQNERIEQLEKALDEVKIHIMYDKPISAMKTIDSALGREE